MAGYDLKININPEYHSNAIKFFEFIKNVSKKYPVSIKYRTINKGNFCITTDSSQSDKIDSLFQELILNKGLHYYYCSLDSNKREVITKNVLVPIYHIIIENRFDNPYSRFIIKHIRGTLPQTKFIPGNFYDPFSREYEIIFRKWTIDLLTDWDFVKDVDAFLNRFLLIVTGHKVGEKSDYFDTLLRKAYKTGIALTPESMHCFSSIHKARTSGLHQLEELLKKDELIKLASDIYWYFQFYDEFQASQQEKTEILKGKRYKRIRYGYEKHIDENGESYKDENGAPIDWGRISKERPCHDCEAIFGQLHVFGCDLEKCACCGGQRLGCECAADEVD